MRSIKGADFEGAGKSAYRKKTVSDLLPVRQTDDCEKYQFFCGKYGVFSVYFTDTDPVSGLFHSALCEYHPGDAAGVHQCGAAGRDRDVFKFHYRGCVRAVGGRDLPGGTGDAVVRGKRDDGADAGTERGQ